MSGRPLEHDGLASDLRRQMPVVRKWAYLDHAAVCPLPSPVAAAMQQWILEASNEGDTVWVRWSRRVEQIREALSRLVNASPEEIALVANTTMGIHWVAEGYPWQPGDNVVTLQDEFPSNIYPWLNLASRGVTLRRVATRHGQLDLDRLEDACDNRTRMVTISWVGYTTGYRHDLAGVADIAHRRGALLMVDAIQGLGVLPIDVQRVPVDFLVADGHKWLLGPEGAGVLYMRREHLDRLRPLGVGWNSVVQQLQFDHVSLDLKSTAARYEGGSYNMAGFMGFGAAVEWLTQHGIDRISQRVLSVAELAIALLEEAGALVVSRWPDEHRSGIVAFELAGRDPAQVRRQCADRGVALSSRAGRLRISPHAYCGRQDLERLIAALGV